MKVCIEASGHFNYNDDVYVEDVSGGRSQKTMSHWQGICRYEVASKVSAWYFFDYPTCIFMFIHNVYKQNVVCQYFIGSGEIERVKVIGFIRELNRLDGFYYSQRKVFKTV